MKKVWRNLLDWELKIGIQTLQMLINSLKLVKLFENVNFSKCICLKFLRLINV